MTPGQGPHFPSPLKGPKDLSRLKEKVDIRQDLGYVLEAITMTRHALDGRVPLIGFAGGPWTLMTYMIEGGGSRMFALVKEWIFKYPEESHELLQRITDVCVDFLVGQVRAGAQVRREYLMSIFISCSFSNRMIATYAKLLFSLESVLLDVASVRFLEW